ncbi:hypothetical protein CMV_020760 [Castanea mollissima]|uniref:Uncharacterized protein n=1 Tax=Castanea mollissima TaxID=60419 RepID=A0A8J4QKW0_9ROSI|nr:hypothetical protein CMV_020760 [Castanea mollissima]
MLEPENYVNGGSGQLKFVAHLLKDKSGIQPFKTFANTVRGHQVQVKGRNHLLSAHDKRKMQLGDNMGEKQNPVFEQRRLSKTPVSILGPMTLEGRDVGPRHSDEEFNLGETNQVGIKRSFQLNFKSKVNGSVYGKEFELWNSHWTREGLTIEVNEEGKRRVTWNSYKGGLRTSKWVIRSQKEHVEGPPSGSRVQQTPMIGSAQYRCVVGIPSKGGWRYSKGGIRSPRNLVVGPSSRSQGQSWCPMLAQTALGSFQSNEVCFSSPSIHEMGVPSSLTSPTPLAHSVIPFISSSEKPETLRLVSCSGSNGISSDSLTVAGIEAGFNSDDLKVRLMVGINTVSSDSLTVAGIEAGFNSDGLKVRLIVGINTVSSDNLTVAGIEAGFNSDGLKGRPMVGFNSCHDRISSDNTVVDGLEFGTSSDGLEVAPMEYKSFSSAGFNSYGHEGAKTDLYDILKRLSAAGFVDFGVNRVDKAGSECSVLLFQGVDNKGTRLLDMSEIGQPNLALVEPKSDCGLTALGEEESLADCNPLLTVIPPGMALSMEMDNFSEVLDIGGTLDVSKWGKNRIPGFSRVIRLSVNCHEKLCIAYL